MGHPQISPPSGEPEGNTPRGQSRSKALAGHWAKPCEVALPEEANFYQPLVDHPRVVRVVALSGGYPLAEANRRLAQNRGIIASFSRALADDLKFQMSEDEFNQSLGGAVDSIFAASTNKV